MEYKNIEKEEEGFMNFKKDVYVCFHRVDHLQIILKAFKKKKKLPLKWA